MTARHLRHTFLAETARSLGISSIALAHHADDQIELFWLRLFRGASSDGLAGMRVQSLSPINPAIQLVRPFLNRWRLELEGFAAQEKVLYREDATNRDESILRNRIRQRLFPLLIRDYQPGLRRVLQRQMDLLAAEADYLDQEAKRWMRSKPAFEALPVALQRRVIAKALVAEGIEPNFDLVELLRGPQGIAVMVAPNHVLRRDEAGRIEDVNKRDLAFQQSEMAVELGSKGQCEWSGLRIWWQVKKRAPRRLAPKADVEWFDAERVGRVIHLRHWRVGDRFEPSGLGTASKLQDLFTNLKIPVVERRSKVVATAADGQIWWVQGLRISQHFKVRSDTRRFLEWRWKPQRKASRIERRPISADNKK
jgi:tRNA(Ile)-lysidine synthase